MALAAFLLAGCGTPDAANILLRKKNQEQASELAKLRQQHVADAATIAAYEGKTALTPALPYERLEKLFTTHGLSLGRLTGGHSVDASSSDDGLMIYAVPTDEQEEPIKAAGSFNVQLFDLNDSANPLVGTWNFDSDQTRKLFYSHLSLYTYVLQCPWQTIPKHANLTVHVTFNDELTGRQFTAQREVKVNLPAQPASAPTTAP